MRINKTLGFFCLCFIYFLNGVKGAKIQQKRDIFASFFISSGTLWCGKGNIAKQCDQLGEYSKTDDCCREHDSCPYTFSSDMIEDFNGYSSHFLMTISHCECDVIFSQCLHELPYKAHSYEVWESYLSLNVKCFSYLPCDNSDEHQNIWQDERKRETGKCVNGSRIMVFDSIMDYSEFMSELKLSQKVLINKRLIVEKNKYVPPNKQKYKCAHSFPNYPQKISNNFESEFLKGDPDFDFLSKKMIYDDKVEFFDRVLNIINSSEYTTYISKSSSKMPTDPTNKVTQTVPVENTTKEKSEHSQNKPKTIFLYNIIEPMVVILAIFVLLKFLIHFYDKDKL